MRKKQHFVLFAIMILLFLSPGCTSSIHLGNKIGNEVFYDSSKSTLSIGNALEKNSVIWEESIYGQFSENEFTTAGRFLFVGDVTGRVYCFDLESGNEAGSLSRRSESLRGGVMVSGDTLRFISIKRENVQSTAVMYDLGKGTYILETEIDDIFGGELVEYHNGSIFLAAKPGRIYKLKDNNTLNASSGRVMSIRALDNHLFIGEELGRLRTFDTNTLNLLRIDSIGTEPVFVKSYCSTVYVSSGNRLFTISNGEAKLLTKFSSEISSYFPINSDRVLVALKNGTISLFENGVITDSWSIAKGFATSFLRISENTISILTVNGTLLLYSTESNSITVEFSYENRISVHPIPTRYGLLIGLERGIVKLLKF